MIYTFYSYRGGIGRSTSLANVAECFYLQGLRVIVVDGDLEFPGLESYFFEPTDGEGVVQSRPGLVDLLNEYRRRFADMPPSAESEPESERETTADFSSDPNDPSGDEPSSPSATQDVVPPPHPEQDFAATLDQRLPALSTYLVPIRSPDPDGGRGSLSLLPAGLRSEEHPLAYAEAVRGLDWKEILASYRGKDLFDWLRGKLLQAADVILIDAPTGMSEAAGVCTRQLADVLVCFCTPYQDLDGVADMVEQTRSAEAIDARGHRPLETVIFPVLLAVPEPEEVSELERRFARLDEALPTVLKEQGLHVWDARMPYHPQLSFHERLVVGRAGGADADELMEAVYRTLASRLSLLAPGDHAIGRQFGRAQEPSPQPSPEPDTLAPATAIVEQPDAAPPIEVAWPLEAASVDAASLPDAAPAIEAVTQAEVASFIDAAFPAEAAPPAQEAFPLEAASPVEAASPLEAAPVEPPKQVPAPRRTALEPSVPPVAAPELAGIRLPPAWGWPAALASALVLAVVVYVGARGSSGERAAAGPAAEVKPAVTETRSSRSDTPAASTTPQPPSQERADHAAVDLGGEAVAPSTPPQDPGALTGLYLRVGRGPSCPRIMNYRKQFLLAGMEDAKAVQLKSGGCALVLGPYGADIAERRRKEHNARHIRGFDTAVVVDTSDFDKWL